VTAGPFSCCEQSGEDFAAAFHLRRSLNIAPQDEAVRTRLAAIEARLATKAKSRSSLAEKAPSRMLRVP
jgi:hypothetical protein